MHAMIGTKELRLRLGDVVRRVGKGGRFTVLYRSRPAFDIVPVGGEVVAAGSAETDSLYQAPPVGRSGDGKAARRHDEVLYG
jgi:antitoxin (DNA-binding transcriptional repressor) of toxin-antitoxin stability system